MHDDGLDVHHKFYDQDTDVEQENLSDYMSESDNDEEDHTRILPPTPCFGKATILGHTEPTKSQIAMAIPCEQISSMPVEFTRFPKDELMPTFGRLTDKDLALGQIWGTLKFGSAEAPPTTPCVTPRSPCVGSPFSFEGSVTPVSPRFDGSVTPVERPKKTRRVNV